MRPLFDQAVRDPGALLLVVSALVAGLAAAFGRELQAGRHPGARWWLARLLLLPLLAIAAATASEALALSPNMTAFVAAMLSLGGYDGLHMLETRWRKRVAAAVDPVPPVHHVAPASDDTGSHRDA